MPPIVTFRPPMQIESVRANSGANVDDFFKPFTERVSSNFVLARKVP